MLLSGFKHIQGEVIIFLVTPVLAALSLISRVVFEILPFTFKVLNDPAPELLTLC